MSEKQLVPAVKQPLSPFGSIADFENTQRMAAALAKSTFIPKEFKGNVGDCLVLLETASRTGLPIMAIMQNMYVVHGKPSFSSSFMAGLINNSGRFDTPLRFKYNDDKTSCYAYTSIDGEEYKGITITMEIAKAEGWLSRAGSKWKTIPELMLQYRATSFFARAYCSDLIMGMKDTNEVIDSQEEYQDAEYDEPVLIDTDTGEVIPKQEEQEPEQEKKTAGPDY